MGINSTQTKFFLELVVLTILRKSPSRKLTNSQIIEQGERSPLVPRCKKASVPSRFDSKFANFVNNIVCHRTSPNNLIRRGRVIWHPALRSLELTESGETYLMSKAKIAATDPIFRWEEFEATLRKIAAQVE
jgi:hypothetical protein